MLGNKQKMTLGNIKTESVSFNGEMVSVKDHLSLMDMAILMGVYMEEYFKDSPTHVIEAEYKLALALLEQSTNIELNEDSIDVILQNFSQWESIKRAIKNYGEFRHLLQKTVDEKKEKRRLDEGVGRTLSVIYMRVEELLNDLRSEEFTPEKIESAKSMLKEINESPILKDAINIFKNREPEEKGK